jgi:hypothetical protein
MSLSPTAEGFRTAFRRPLFSFAEISWRWAFGGAAIVLLFFGFVEFLDTLPITSGELFFLRTKQPFLVEQAIAHILRGSIGRGVMSLAVAALLLMVLWLIAASFGRMVTIRALVDYFRRDEQSEVRSDWWPLLNLNFLRVVVLIAAGTAWSGGAMLAAAVSPSNGSAPGAGFVFFLPFAALIFIAGWVLDWFLSLAGMFAVRDGQDAWEAISAAATFCMERPGSVFAVSVWTGLAHLIAFVIGSSAVSMLVGLAGALPWRAIALGIAIITLVYFAVADWLYMARLSGYLFIAETPESLLRPGTPVAPSSPPVETTIDRNELILSDVPGLVPET